MISATKELINTLDKSKLEPQQNQMISTIEESIGIKQTFQSVLQPIVDNSKLLARKLGKLSPKVEITGGTYDLDEKSAELLADIFTHLFNNSLDHGIETSEIRLKKGKSAQGNITIDMSQQKGGEFHILFFDDGQGINLNKVKEKATSNGLIKKDAELSNDAIARLIFQSGFSTKEEVSETSGRGIGLDAVKSYLEEFGHRINIELRQEQGNEIWGFAFHISLMVEAKKLAS